MASRIINFIKRLKHLGKGGTIDSSDCTNMLKNLNKESPINCSNPRNPDYLCNIIVSTWQKLDVDILSPYLSDDFKYNSAWVSDTIASKECYLDYLRGKFETIRKSGNNIVVEAIDEFEHLRPRIRQTTLGAETILDFEQKDGFIVKMFMRPIIKTSVIDDCWPQCKTTYTDNLPKAIQIAGYAIQSFIEAQGINQNEFSWLQTSLISPSFQHICFRYHSDVYSILIAMHGCQSPDEKNGDEIILSKQDYDNLLTESEKNNLIPCIAPVALTAQLPMLNGLNLIHAISGKPIVLNSSTESKQVAMSKWEINSMGVDVVVQYLQEQNLKVKSHCNMLGIQPQIWFEMDGKTSYVIVHSIPIGERSEKFPICKDLFANLAEYQGYFANVMFASSSPILKDENGQIVPLSKRDTDGDVWMWRGDGFYCYFNGLQNIQDALESNSVICI